MMRFRIIVLGILAPAMAALRCAAQGNPYGVSGANWSPNGVMVSLDMPAGAPGYIWDTLQVTNEANMVRPCKYWISVGSTHRFHGYHEDTETIDDPDAFGAWIDAHPGKIWIIGNEPDLASQDGLTPLQYAAMFRTYREFIAQRDPTARFAVGALSGDAVEGSLDAAIIWWNQALDAYRSRYGVPMPIDIWNYHCYAPPHLRDARRYMEIYADRFCRWVKRIDKGRYADAEIWCTEFGIGFWHGPLNAGSVAPWMHRVCLELEDSDVDRWFWFLGPWDTWSGGLWQQTCLLDASRNPTVLGTVYSDLARGFPNTGAIPMQDPPITPSPAVFRDDFANGDPAGWILKSGDWHIDGGALRNTVVGPWWGHYAALPHPYADFSIEADVRILSAPDPNNWAGFYFRFPVMYGGRAQGGYLAYLRRNGTLGLYTRQDGTVAAVAAAVADTSVYHRLAVECSGDPARIRVLVDGVIRIEWTDPNGRFASGFVALEAGHSDCAFDNVVVRVLDVPNDGLDLY